MENKKINLAILFGGKSAEHEVSLQSAKNVFDAIDKEKYNPILIGIDKNGVWKLKDKNNFLVNASDPKNIKLSEDGDLVAFIPESNGWLYNLDNPSKKIKIDVCFPILHGPFGEDGTLQGLLKLANVGFVGASVLGSAVGMDKDIMKRLLRDAGIKISKFITLKNCDKILKFEEVVEKLKKPFFIKPANMGSSVGVSKIHNKSEYENAIKESFLYDNKIILEENISGREIECSVLGNESVSASKVGEIILKDDFYSYNTKYIDENGAILEIPAKLPEKIEKEVQNLAIKTFRVLSCEGFARVDFFLKEDGEIVVNEINTIPGFTKISMYPKLWEESGISYTKLIDKLINLAIDRFKEEKKLKTSF